MVISFFAAGAIAAIYLLVKNKRKTTKKQQLIDAFQQAQQVKTKAKGLS